MEAAPKNEPEGSSPIATRSCFSCETSNPADQNFCGACGSSLTLSGFISETVSQQLATTIRDRNIIETESAIKVFERAWSWVKIVGGIAAVLLAILGGSVAWKFSDWKSSVNNAKQSVTTTANSVKAQIDETAAKSVGAIKAASTKAQSASAEASTTADEQTIRIKATADQTRAELRKERASVTSDVTSAEGQLKAATALKPQMDAIQQELSHAIAEVEEQKKILSSSQEFAKQVFSTHTFDSIDFSDSSSGRSVVISLPPPVTPPPPPTGPGVHRTTKAVAYFLLHSTPINGTLDMQMDLVRQPPGSYLPVVHNLVIFLWGDAPAAIKLSPFTVSYFPDTGDKELIHSLTEKDGRVYADGEPLPKFGEMDPDFKGNKWMPLVRTTPPAAQLKR